MNSVTQKVLSVILAAGMTLSVFSIGAGAAEPLPIAAVIEETAVDKVDLPVVKAEIKTAEKTDTAVETEETENSTPNYLQKIINTIKDLVAIIRAALAFLDKVKTK